MKKKRVFQESTRPSRDGHEFHEAWAARKALQLVLPLDDLIGIAVEGLAPADQKGASTETVEIADLVLYFGDRSTFEAARSVVIVQIKYSISHQNDPFRASNAKKTIGKFAVAFKDHIKRYGAKTTAEKLSFELVTNRPIYEELQKAIFGIANEKPLKGNAKKQADQVVAACRLNGDELRDFAAKISITGLAGNLSQNKSALSRVLANWSVAPDAMARARLGAMRDLVRDKAGSKGEGRNVIEKTDVFSALEVDGPESLFPTPTSFPEIGEIVERDQLQFAVELIPQLTKPMLIHADGGVGKTVFLQSVAKQLGDTHEMILFDCFGGGAYRAPEDARHLPKRALTHIINSLACRGFCDPLLPTNSNVEELVKAFRSRLVQTVEVLRRGSKGRQLIIFLDAIDNAAEYAKERFESAFPRVLLESIFHGGPIDGVQLVASCRTYRRDISRGELPCEEFRLEPFSSREAEAYLRARIPELSDTQVRVAYSRSGGNPRILEHLALSDRGLLEPSEFNNVIVLDDLINARIQSALGAARKQGYTDSTINAFLAGLSVLPPPVPLEDYADALGIELSAVKSFAADLAPLLELTQHGIMFRDELILPKKNGQ